MTAATTLVLGLDEAGRGPALGALVLAAVALDPAAARRLARAGVADSKSFGAGDKAHAARARLRELIERHAAFVGVEVCDVETVDAYTEQGLLNALEREVAARLIDRAPAVRRIVADGRTLFSPLGRRWPHLEAHDDGEARHVAVAAASLCAKVRRDELFACIAGRYAHAFGPVAGMGYANADTRAFADRFVARFGRLPPEARRSWPWPGRPAPVRAGAQPRVGQLALDLAPAGAP